MVNKRLFLVLALTLAPPVALADLFREIGSAYAIDPDLLRAIAQQESQMNPHALNINGEPCMDKAHGFVIEGKEVFCDSVENSVAVVRTALVNPYVLKVTSPKGHKYRFWVASEKEGRSFAKRHNLTINKLARKNTRNIDFGLMQINWPAHKKNITTASRLFEPRYNLNYAAKHLSELNDKHGPIEAVGAYHAGPNGSAKRKAGYREKVLERYLALKD